MTDADMRHAVRHATRRIELEDDLTMVIGASTDGTMLEIGVLGLDGEDPVIIHAMRLRPKFYRFLG